MTYYPSLIKFPENWNIRRNTLNKKEEYPKYTYGKTFDETYDYHTLFIDVFRDGEQVIFVSPPFLNFKDILISELKLIDEYKNQYQMQFIDLDRCSLMISAVPSNIDSLFLTKENGDNFEIKIKPRCSDFDGKKVLCTMQKNEPIYKITNWIQYHNTLYDVEGFIVFNHQSELYTNEFLYEKIIEKIPQNVFIEVVDWNIPFGVIGPPWDSDWSQYIMLNLCKYNFCKNSKLLINHDLDEYFVSEYSLDEIIESMISNDCGAVIYESKNISCYTDTDSEFLNQRYYYHPDEVDEFKMTKWIAIPSKTLRTIYTLHSVYGTNVEPTQDFYYAHMWPLSSKNHDQSNHCSPKDYRKTCKDDGYKIDHLLKSNFDKCPKFKM